MAKKVFKGIDISEHQGKIDFKKLKGNVDFVIIRAGYGRLTSQKDSKFEEYYKGCKDNDIPVGAYWFSYATSSNDAALEAQACLSVIKGKTFEYPIYYDIEGDCLGKSKSVCSAMCKSFASTLEKSGYYAGVYTSRSPLQTKISDEVKERYAIWVAEYPKLNYSGSYGMWQKTSSGKVSGISTNVDLDECYVDYPSAIKKAGLNGYKPESNKKILDTTGVKKGDKSLAVLSYKQLLRIAKKKGIIDQSIDNNSSFGEGTEKATNLLLKKYGYTQNGIAGTNLVKKLGTELSK